MAITKTVNFAALRNDFPLLRKSDNGKPLVYLDSGASAQKPSVVMKAMDDFYTKNYANIHRGIYELSARATKMYENVRHVVADFIQAERADEIVFLRGTTEAINLVADTMSRSWRPGDEVILSEMEHHSNIVPWYLLKERLGIVLKVVPVTDDGSLDMDAYRAFFSERTKMVAITHTSNVLGTINPAKQLTTIAHEHDVPILLDGAQAVPHMPVDVRDIDCDFYVFSGHKLYGPTGIGVLYAKKAWLDRLPPYQGGGDMIETVAFDKVTFAKGPQKFEAGTPDIAGVIGLSAAIHYLNEIGLANIFAHEQALLAYATPILQTIPGLRIIGMSPEKVGVISFVIDGIHPHDIGTVLDHEHIAIRAGHHCAMPLMERYHLPATARASFGLYNNEQDIDALVEALKLAKRLFA